MDALAAMDGQPDDMVSEGTASPEQPPAIERVTREPHLATASLHRRRCLSVSRLVRHSSIVAPA
jgi:hypothetical protein